MEAIWNLENKWKISTHGAVSLLVVCICSLVIGTCIIAALRIYVRKRTDDQEPCIDDSTSTDVDCSEPRAELGSVKEDLTSSVRGSQKQKLSPLLASGDHVEADLDGRVPVQIHLCGKGLYLWVKSVSCQSSVVLFCMIREATPLHQADNGFNYQLRDEVK